LTLRASSLLCLSRLWPARAVEAHAVAAAMAEIPKIRYNCNKRERERCRRIERVRAGAGLGKRVLSRRPMKGRIRRGWRGSAWVVERKALDRICRWGCSHFALMLPTHHCHLGALVALQLHHGVVTKVLLSHGPRHSKPYLRVTLS
jgi:hypothetical protein